MKIKDISKIVENILWEDEVSRIDDNYLIYRTVKKIVPETEYCTFKYAMDMLSDKGISFESITRARRRAQEKYPELKIKSVADKREEKQQEYVEFAEDIIRQHIPCID